MIYIITGDVEIGKSTVCARLIDLAQTQEMTCGGFITKKDTQGNLFLEDVTTGWTTLFAIKKTGRTFQEGYRYKFQDDAFTIGNQLIEQNCSAQLLVLDELGARELQGEGFSSWQEVVQTRSDMTTVLVIRKKLLQNYKKILNCDTQIFEVTEHNRENLHKDLFSLINPKS